MIKKFTKPIGLSQNFISTPKSQFDIEPQCNYSKFYPRKENLLRLNCITLTWIVGPLTTQLKSAICLKQIYKPNLTRIPSLN